MTTIHSAFSKSYAEARQKFLNAAQQAGLQVESHIHPETGRDGEELAMDVVREGPADAKQVLLVSNATVAPLQQDALPGEAVTAGAAISVAAARLAAEATASRRRVRMEPPENSNGSRGTRPPSPSPARY